MRNTIIPVAALACMLATMEALGASMTIVQDGKPNCVIVTPSVPNDGAAFAAQELQYHLKKVTGADVRIVSDRDELPADTLPIFVGDGAGPRKLGFSTKDFTAQEYMLKFTPAAIVLMGKDTVEYPVSAGRNTKPLKNGRFGSAWNPGWNCATVVEHGFNDDHGTMECFVYRPEKEGESATGMLIWGIGDGNNAHRLTTEKQENKTYALVYETKVNGQATKATVKEPWANREPGWHHVMCTWDATAGRQEIYFNGKLADSVAYTRTQCAGFPAFGIKSMSDAVPYCVGPIDEIRLSAVVRKPVVPTEPYEPDSDTRILMHCDDPSGFPHDSSEQPRSITRKPARDGKLATMYAVYDFIEEYLGVRWYMPGELGMVYDERKTVTVNGKDVRRKPAMVSRTNNGPVGPAEDEWGGRMQRLLIGEFNGDDLDLYSYRLRQGGPRLAANHSFYGYHDRYKAWKADPASVPKDEAELFEKGTFMAEGYPEPTQLCYSSPDTVAQIVKDARAYFDTGETRQGASVGQDWFGVVPSDDGWWCQCEKCQAMLKFRGKESGNNVPTVYGHGLESNASYMVWDFTRRVAEEVQKTHPDKYINQLAYIEYLGQPVDNEGKPVDLPSNLILGCCLGTRPIIEFDPARNRELAIYKDWMKLSNEKNWLECFWLYQCFPNEFGARQGWNWWPGFHAHDLDKSMRMFIKDNVDGLFLCGVADYIDGWLTFKYMYNPDFDVDKELDAFFTRFYGPAAKPMKEFYLLAERRFLDPNNYPRSGYQAADGITWSSLGTPPVMARLRELIEEADKLAQSDPYKRRFRLFRQGVWDHMREGYDKWTAKQPGGKHPWPFRVQNPLDTQERGIPYFGRAYMRSGANPVGLWKHGFDDSKGTMEAAVWCGPAKASGLTHGPGTLFEIAPHDLSSGHRVRIDTAPKLAGFVVTYETWVGSKTNRIASAPLKTNQWHQIAAVWQTGTNGAMALYADQKMAGKKPYSRTACNKAATFDIAGGVNGTSFGAIDEVRLSKIVRKPVKQTAPFKTDPNTLLLLNFDEPEGEMARDHSGIER